jgi:hypothetical protein
MPSICVHDLNVPVFLDSHLLPATAMQGLLKNDLLLGKWLGKRQRCDGIGSALHVAVLDQPQQFEQRNVAVVVVWGSDARCNCALGFELLQFLLESGCPAVMHLNETAKPNNEIANRSYLQLMASVISVGWSELVHLRELIPSFLCSENERLNHIANKAHDPLNKLLFDEAKINRIERYLGLGSRALRHVFPSKQRLIFSDFDCITVFHFLHGFDLLLCFESAFVRDSVLRKLQQMCKVQAIQHFRIASTIPKMNLESIADESHQSRYPFRILLVAHWYTTTVKREMESVLFSICQL